MTNTDAVTAEELVCVVIPAYNAEATIDETLRSVRSQTHSNLEIIVVDDGSRDHTSEIAGTHAAADSRIRLVRQDNAGVAVARNTGWNLSSAKIFSFVDADDLWSPDKTERQLAVLRANPGVGLVYSWYVMIDDESRITLQWPGEEWEGDVLRHLFHSNFIGNGSSAMVTRKALEDALGFEPALRAAGAQGCEDVLFYSRVAEHHRFALARGHLIGYRYIEGNMSSDLPKMLRSWLIAMSEFELRHPDKLKDIDVGFERFSRWLVRRAVQLSQPHYLPGLLRIIAHRSIGKALAILGSEVPKALYDFHRPSVKRATQSAEAGNVAGPRFEIGTP